MTHYQELPPQDDPKQPTAKHHPDSLGEHLQAFLNNNNPNGFLAEPTDNSVSIASVLFSIAVEPYTTFRTASIKAKKIKRLTDKTVTYSQALEFIAQIQGYRDWREVRHLNDDKGIVNKSVDVQASMRKLQADLLERTRRDRETRRTISYIVENVQRLEADTTLVDDPKLILSYRRLSEDQSEQLRKLGTCLYRAFAERPRRPGQKDLVKRLAKQKVFIHLMANNRGYLKTQKGLVLFSKPVNSSPNAQQWENTHVTDNG